MLVGCCAVAKNAPLYDTTPNVLCVQISNTFRVSLESLGACGHYMWARHTVCSSVDRTPYLILGNAVLIVYLKMFSNDRLRNLVSKGADLRIRVG